MALPPSCRTVAKRVADSGTTRSPCGGAGAAPPPAPFSFFLAGGAAAASAS